MNESQLTDKTKTAKRKKSCCMRWDCKVGGLFCNCYHRLHYIKNLPLSYTSHTYMNGRRWWWCRFYVHLTITSNAITEFRKFGGIFRWFCFSKISHPKSLYSYFAANFFFSQFVRSFSCTVRMERNQSCIANCIYTHEHIVVIKQRL